MSFHYTTERSNNIHQRDKHNAKPRHILLVMPLIVNGDGNLAGSYSERDLVRGLYTRPQEPTETTPLHPHARKRDHSFTRLRRRLKMRRFCITCLVLAELCERFAYYGIIINLVLFLDNFGWSMFVSASGVLVYSGVAWFMCALGGLVADSRFGRHSTIIAGFIIYFIGALLLVGISIWVDDRQQSMDPDGNLPVLPWLAVVLLCIASGEGAVKSNLSTFSAEQLKGEPPNGASKSLFNCFYWVANIVALCGLAGVTYIQQTRLAWSSGFTLGFAIPVVSLTFAAAAFMASSKYFVVDGPHGTGLRNVRLIVKQAWGKRNDKVETRELSPRSSIPSAGKTNWLDKATVQFGGTFLKSEINETRALGKCFLFCLTLIPYWMVYSQLYSTYILQGLHLMSVSDTFLVPAAWMTLIETAVVLMLIPLMERLVYPTCAQYNIQIPRLWRVVFGLMLVAASAGMAGYVEVAKAAYFQENGYINQTTSLRIYSVVNGFSVLNQIPQYALLGISEIFASMSGLEMVYSMCPAMPQSVTSGIYNLMISVGSLFSLLVLGIVALYDWYPLHIDRDDIDYLRNSKVASYYWLLSGIVLMSAFVLIVIGYRCGIGIQRNHYHFHDNDEVTSTPAGGSTTSEINNSENPEISIRNVTTIN